jgi:methionyl aminopeptidase
MKVDLDKLRLSGRISATARETCKKLIRPGVKLESIALEAETIIRDMGGKPAFPAQLSRNNIAAHYCSPPGDPTEAQDDDIIKFDCGTQVDGYVTDNATTVDLRDGEGSMLVKASEMALENAISMMGPGASLTEVGRQIESTIKAMGFTPVYNLTGHGVARWVIHCKPSVPNYPDPKAASLRAGQTVACEPFACDGRGSIEEAGRAEVFMLLRSPRAKELKKFPPDIADAIAATENLPFARRSLLRILGTEKKVEQAMDLLKKSRLIADYPPLVEKEGVRVAQTEHTIFIHEDRAEVITLAPD